MPVWIAGRRVYVNTQQTQTVKICTPQNTRGLISFWSRTRRPGASGTLTFLGRFI